MNVQVQTRTPTVFNARWLGAWVLTSCLTLNTFGQVVLDNQCSAPNTHHYYVESVQRQTAPENPSEEMIQTLECIARKDKGGFSAGSRAVRLLFALIEDDAEARKLLLSLALDNDASATVQSTSCELLTLVSDPTSNREIMNRLKTTWPSGHWQAYFQLLRDVGASEFLEWLEEYIEASAVDSSTRQFFQRAAAMVKIQRTPNEILTHFESQTCSFDCSWFILQAYRHGVDADVVRESLLSVLSRTVDDRRNVILQRQLLEDTFRYGILSPTDIQRISEVQELVHLGKNSRGPRKNNWVEQRIAAKRAEFYRLKISDSESIYRTR